MKKNTHLLFFALALGSSGSIWSSFTLVSNFGMPFDSNMWCCNQNMKTEMEEKNSSKKNHMHEDEKQFCLTSGVSVEHGFGEEGRNKDNETVDVYSIYSATENLAVLSTTEITNLGLSNVNYQSAVLVDPEDTSAGYRIKPTSSRSRTDLNLWNKLILPVESIPGQVEVCAYLPIRFIETGSTSWNRKVIPQNVPAPPTGLALTDPDEFISGVTSGLGLNINTFKESYIGDLHLMLGWKNCFEQVHDSLSSVSLSLQSGLIIPTSRNTDPNLALDVPFGNENALAVPISGCVNLNFMDRISLGGCVDIVPSFGEDSTRRIKRYATEGEIILSKTYNVRRDPGTLVRFTTSCQAMSGCKRFSFAGIYQYGWANEDKFTSNDAGFNKVVADAAEKAQEANYHNFMVRASVDFAKLSDSKFAPKLSATYKFPLKGKRIVLYDTFSFEASVQF